MSFLRFGILKFAGFSHFTCSRTRVQFFRIWLCNATGGEFKTHGRIKFQEKPTTETLQRWLGIAIAIKHTWVFMLSKCLAAVFFSVEDFKRSSPSIWNHCPSEQLKGVRILRRIGGMMGENYVVILQSNSIVNNCESVWLIDCIIN